jgi:hypothetical protein
VKSESLDDRNEPTIRRMPPSEPTSKEGGDEGGG